MYMDIEEIFRAEDNTAQGLEGLGRFSSKCSDLDSTRLDVIYRQEVCIDLFSPRPPA